MRNRSAEDIIEDLLAHLEHAADALTLAWGRDESAQRGNPPDIQEETLREWGRRTLNEAHRRLLLWAITDLWVDYLTRVEALRVSISLEAYAQRDPLVQYKSRASEMFHGLLEDIRAMVVGRLFAYQRRPALELMEEPPAESGEERPASQPVGGGRKKRKRH